MDLPLNDISYSWLPTDDVERAYELECQGYPPEEGASLDTLRYRQKHANDLFLGAYHHSTSHELIAFVCATLSPGEHLEHESMFVHTPDSPTVCIHSVCVSPRYRRRGVALGLLKEYFHRLTSGNLSRTVPYIRVLLLTHNDIVPLYQRAGFDVRGVSHVVHGPKPWYEMERLLGTTLSAAHPPPGPGSEETELPVESAGIHQKSFEHPASRLLSDFADITEVSEIDTQGIGSLVNKYDLLCPRPDCGGIVLKRGMATQIGKFGVQLDPVDGSPLSLLSALSPSITTHLWLVRPSSLMSPRNVAFSLPSSEVADTLRRCIFCATCGLGPLGWCEEGDDTSWLACSRVRYGS